MNQVFSNILVVQDAYRDTVDAMEWAAQMVSPSGSVKLLDVQPPLSEFWAEMFANEYEQTPLSHRQKSLSELAKSVEFATPRVTTQVRCGTPVVEIVRESLNGRFDLVIKEAYAKASDFFFGSVDMRLMRYCPTPVWMVNPQLSNTCQRILVAINPEADEKEMKLNQRLIDYAAKIATGFDCKLFVVAAYNDHKMVYPAFDGASMDRAVEHSKTVKRHARDKIATLIEKSPKSIEPKNIILEDGWPSEVIVNAVEKVQPELLVMGSVARHGLTGLMFGNAAERVLRRVKCSVLTIKPKDFVCTIGIEESSNSGAVEGKLAF